MKNNLTCGRIAVVSINVKTSCWLDIKYNVESRLATFIVKKLHTKIAKEVFDVASQKNINT